MFEDLYLDLTPLKLSQLETRRFALLPRLALLALAPLLANVAHASSEHVEPTFRVQTSLLPVKFPEKESSSLTFAGRNKDGTPVLGVLQIENGSLRYRELDLPRGRSVD